MIQAEQTPVCISKKTGVVTYWSGRMNVAFEHSQILVEKWKRISSVNSLLETKALCFRRMLVHSLFSSQFLCLSFSASPVISFRSYSICSTVSRGLGPSCFRPSVTDTVNGNVRARLPGTSLNTDGFFLHSPLLDRIYFLHNYQLKQLPVSIQY